MPDSLPAPSGSRITRRQALKTLSSAAAAVLAAPAVLRGRFALFAGSAATYSARCIGVVQRSLVIDMLSQFKLGAFLDVLGGPGPRVSTWFSHPETFTAADFERYRSSGITVFHIGWGYGRDAYDDAQKIVAAWNRLLGRHPQWLVRIDRAPQFDWVKRGGKVGILLGFQNSDHFRTVADVDDFYRLGQRVSQLTYNVRNAIGCGYEEPADTGLTPFGGELIARMNRVGMAVDVSHCGDQTTRDAFAASRQPVLITHANCRALNRHPRCKSDEVIRKMAAGGGVMGISGVRMFVHATEPTTIEHVLDHFDHVAKLVGVEHVGVGSDIDLDGYDKLPPVLRRRMLVGYKNSPAFRGGGEIEGLNHPKRMFDLTEGLIRRGYSDAQIELILGGNFRRALAEIWKLAAQ
ncbi:MAG: dipeptidase [Terriglobales bacterium]